MGYIFNTIKWVIIMGTLIGIYYLLFEFMGWWKIIGG